MLHQARSGSLNIRPALEQVLLGIAVIGLGLYAVWPWLSGQQSASRRTIVVYGFSIFGEAINRGIFPAFEAQWEQRTGEDVELISSFAGSGTVTNQIILGVPAQIAFLSLELDGWRLVDEGVLPGPTWQTLPHRGVINRSPFVIVVRPGNPHGVGGFADLAQPGIGIVHPDPLTSGGAQWAILAEYGSALRQTGDPAQATQQLTGIWRNIVAQAASARAARTQYEGGFGDVLITYEQELVYDQMRGDFTSEVIYPPSTILSEHIAVVIDGNISADDREMIDAFVEFLWSDTAQQIFADYGFRSVNEALNETNRYFGAIDDPFLVEDLGGWLQAKSTLIDAIWKESVLPEVAR